jgi:serine/threonine protein kinase
MVRHGRVSSAPQPFANTTPLASLVGSAYSADYDSSSDEGILNPPAVTAAASKTKTAPDATSPMHWPAAGLRLVDGQDVMDDVRQAAMFKQSASLAKLLCPVLAMMSASPHLPYPRVLLAPLIPIITLATLVSGEPSELSSWLLPLLHVVSTIIHALGSPRGVRPSLSVDPFYCLSSILLPMGKVSSVLLTLPAMAIFFYHSYEDHVAYLAAAASDANANANANPSEPEPTGQDATKHWDLQFSPAMALAFTAIPNLLLVILFSSSRQLSVSFTTSIEVARTESEQELNSGKESLNLWLKKQTLAQQNASKESALGTPGGLTAKVNRLLNQGARQHTPSRGRRSKRENQARTLTEMRKEKSYARAENRTQTERSCNNAERHPSSSDFVAPSVGSEPAATELLMSAEALTTTEAQTEIDAIPSSAEDADNETRHDLRDDVFDDTYAAKAISGSGGGGNDGSDDGGDDGGSEGDGGNLVAVTSPEIAPSQTLLFGTLNYHSRYLLGSKDEYTEEEASVLHDACAIMDRARPSQVLAISSPHPAVHMFTIKSVADGNSKLWSQTGLQNMFVSKVNVHAPPHYVMAYLNDLRAFGSGKSDMLQEVTDVHSGHSFTGLYRRWHPTPFLPRDFYVRNIWKRLDASTWIFVITDETALPYPPPVHAQVDAEYSRKYVRGRFLGVLLIEANHSRERFRTSTETAIISGGNASESEDSRPNSPAMAANADDSDGLSTILRNSTITYLVDFELKGNTPPHMRELASHRELSRLVDLHKFFTLPSVVDNLRWARTHKLSEDVGPNSGDEQDGDGSIGSKRRWEASTERRERIAALNKSGKFAALGQAGSNRAMQLVGYSAASAANDMKNSRFIFFLRSVMPRMDQQTDQLLPSQYDFDFLEPALPVIQIDGSTVAGKMRLLLDGVLPFADSDAEKEFYYFAAILANQQVRSIRSPIFYGLSIFSFIAQGAELASHHHPYLSILVSALGCALYVLPNFFFLRMIEMISSQENVESEQAWQDTKKIFVTASGLLCTMLVWASTSHQILTVHYAEDVGKGGNDMPFLTPRHPTNTFNAAILVFLVAVGGNFMTFIPYRNALYLIACYFVLSMSVSFLVFGASIDTVRVQGFRLLVISLVLYFVSIKTSRRKRLLFGTLWVLHKDKFKHDNRMKSNLRIRQSHTKELDVVLAQLTEPALAYRLRGLLSVQIEFNELEFVKEIGKGGNGAVFVAFWRNQTVAVKQILKDDFSTASVMSFIGEIHLGLMLDHPNIIKIVGCVLKSPNLCCVLEYAKMGSLKDVLKRERALDWANGKRSLAFDVASAMCYLHERPSPIIHRDLKTRNVLIMDWGAAKLSDFGTARVWSPDDEELSVGVGTKFFMAPEVMVGDRYGPPSDVYSFGCLLADMAMKGDIRMLFTEGEDMPKSPLEFMNRIVGGWRPALPARWQREMPLVCELVRACWDPVAYDRPPFRFLYEELEKWDGEMNLSAIQNNSIMRQSDMYSSYEDALIQEAYLYLLDGYNSVVKNYMKTMTLTSKRRGGAKIFPSVTADTTSKAAALEFDINLSRFEYLTDNVGSHGVMCRNIPFSCLEIMDYVVNWTDPYRVQIGHLENIESHRGVSYVENDHNQINVVTKDFKLIKSREFVLRSVWKKISDSTYVYIMKSTEHPSHPISNHSIRAQIKSAVLVQASANGDSSNVTFKFNILGVTRNGSMYVPNLMNTAQAEGLASFLFEIELFLVQKHGTQATSKLYRELASGSSEQRKLVHIAEEAYAYRMEHLAEYERAEINGGLGSGAEQAVKRDSARSDSDDSDAKSDMWAESSRAERWKAMPGSPALESRLFEFTDSTSTRKKKKKEKEGEKTGWGKDNSDKTYVSYRVDEENTLELQAKSDEASGKETTLDSTLVKGEEDQPWVSKGASNRDKRRQSKHKRKTIVKAESATPKIVLPAPAVIGGDDEND